MLLEKYKGNAVMSMVRLWMKYSVAEEGKPHIVIWHLDSFYGPKKPNDGLDLVGLNLTSIAISAQFVYCC
jgi:hypothetical protein